MSEEPNELFDDTPAAEVKEPDATPKDAAQEPEQKQTEDDKQGEDTSGTPPEQDESSKGTKAEKMVPESRLKAALKDITDKFDLTTKQLNEAQAELSKLKATPAPDKETDPEGYDLHIRLEASKAAMRSLQSDYDEVIKHFKGMEEANPIISEAVSRHPAPALYAYQLAKEDMKIKELSALKDSPLWKQFEEFRKQQEEKAKTGEHPQADSESAAPETSVADKLSAGAPKVPNLNRATNVSKNSAKASDDAEELFKGAL